jgi:hypothetical protein
MKALQGVLLLRKPQVHNSRPISVSLPSAELLQPNPQLRYQFSNIKFRSFLGHQFGLPTNDFVLYFYAHSHSIQNSVLVSSCHSACLFVCPNLV